jgi:hypothetical protein
MWIGVSGNAEKIKIFSILLFLIVLLENFPKVGLGLKGPFKFGKSFLLGNMESAPFLFNHSLYLAIGNRNTNGTNGTSVSIYSYFSGNLIKRLKFSDIDLVSAIVSNGRVYIFGSTNWSKPNTIVMIYSTNMLDWSVPKPIFRSSNDETIFNTSISSTPSGYVMSYEVLKKGGGSFRPRFATSPDLMNWAVVPDFFDGSRYAACPTIRFSKGHYYLTYLSIVGNQFKTIAARSPDLKHWEYATKPAFAPGGGEGLSTSDVDWAQYLGMTFFVYAIGDQKNWVSLKRAVYFGSIESFFNSFTYQTIRTF